MKCIKRPNSCFLFPNSTNSKKSIFIADIKHTCTCQSDGCNGKLFLECKEWLVKITSFVMVKGKDKGSTYSITERRVLELIPVLGSQPAGDVSHKPGGRLPLLSTRPAVSPTTLKRAATNFAAWWTEVQWVWTVCLRLLPDSITTAILTRALLRLSPAC